MHGLTREMFEARQVVVYALRELVGESFASIARRLGVTHAATLTAGYRRTQHLIASEPAYAKHIADCLTSVVDAVTAQFGVDPLPRSASMPYNDATASAVLEAVAGQFHMRLDDLLKRGRQFALQRHVAVYVLRQVTDGTAKAIAHHLNLADHTAVRYARQVVSERMARDKVFADRVNDALATARSMLALEVVQSDNYESGTPLPPGIPAGHHVASPHALEAPVPMSVDESDWMPAHTVTQGSAFVL